MNKPSLCIFNSNIHIYIYIKYMIHSRHLLRTYYMPGNVEGSLPGIILLSLKKFFT